MALPVLNWVLGTKPGAKKKRGAPKKVPYETARDIAAKGGEEERRQLAANEETEPEILYFFATDRSPQVRREIATNKGTPLQADLILVEDKDDEVRIELAKKIGRLIPELNPEENQRLAEMAIQILEMLARDELPRVRAIIAEELKNASNVPPTLVRQLAEDLEDIVAAPVLEYSPLLSERDLLEIIARGMRSHGLIAIAKRNGVPEKVAKALVDVDDAAVVGALLRNKTATIGDKSYDTIAEKAELNREWHNAMVYRDDLPLRTILRIATFVNAALMEALIQRNKHSKHMVDELRKVVRQRIDKGDLPVPGETPLQPEPETPGAREDPMVSRVKHDIAAGLLNEGYFIQQLDKGDFEYVKCGLTELSGLPSKTVNQMLGTKTAKAAVAVAWKAGLTMKAAELLQSELIQLPGDKVMRAGPNGSYPLSDPDLDWYVESFSV